MSRLQWYSWFEIGNERIDSEHRIFLDLIHSVEDCSYNKSPEKLNRAIGELQKYTDFHFSSEQNIMLDYEYSLYSDHKKLHDNLLSELDSYAVSIKSGKASIEMMITFLYNWFASHTINEDLKLSAHIKLVQLREFQQGGLGAFKSN